MTDSVEDIVLMITSAQFTPVRLREGYEMGEVDDLLDRVVAGLRSGDPVEDLVRRARFPLVKFREGYDMGEVDDLLDRVVSAASERQLDTPPAYRAPAVLETTATSPPPSTPPTELPSAIEEQRGLLARILGRR